MPILSISKLRRPQHSVPRALGDIQIFVNDRHVTEALERVAKKADLIARLEQRGHNQQAERARELMKTFQQTLTVAHLKIERVELRKSAQQKT